jgi:hypothetical protein
VTDHLEGVADPECVSPQWLTNVLVASSAAPPGARVEHVGAERIGAGKLGRNIRYELSWSNPGDGPHSVVAKFASDDATSRQTGLGLGIYAREIGFYRDVAPTLPARIPRCHYAAMNATTGDFVLVLEDIRPSRAGDQLAGCSTDEASAALAELALLHAARWGDRSLAQLPCLEKGLFEDGGSLQAFYQALLPGFADKYAERLTPETLEVAARFGDGVARWAAPEPAVTTVLHGDYRLDNLLFGPAGSRVAIVDWQTVSLGEGVRDASYFVGAGLLPEARREHEVALLREYHDALSGSGVTGYGWDECWHGYRYASFGGLLMAVVASMVVGDGERSDAMFCAMAERHAQQAVDLDAFALIG